IDQRIAPRGEGAEETPAGTAAAVPKRRRKGRGFDGAVHREERGDVAGRMGAGEEEAVHAGPAMGDLLMDDLGEIVRRCDEAVRGQPFDAPGEGEGAGGKRAVAELEGEEGLVSADGHRRCPPCRRRGAARAAPGNPRATPRGAR